MLNSVCVSEGLSKSYGEASLRFSCRHGHNFFLSVQQVKQTYVALKRSQGGRPHPERLLHELSWCNKCAKRVNEMDWALRRRGIEVLSGINSERISLVCHRCHDFFNVAFTVSTKKPDSVSCPKCTRLEAEA